MKRQEQQLRPRCAARAAEDADMRVLMGDKALDRRLQSPTATSTIRASLSLPRMHQHVRQEPPGFLPLLRTVGEGTLQDARVQGDPLPLGLPHSVVNEDGELGGERRHRQPPPQRPLRMTGVKLPGRYPTTLLWSHPASSSDSIRFDSEQPGRTGGSPSEPLAPLSTHCPLFPPALWCFISSAARTRPLLPPKDRTGRETVSLSLQWRKLADGTSNKR